MVGKQTYGFQSGKDQGRDNLEVWDQQTDPTIHKTNKQQVPIYVQHRELYAQYSIITYMEKEPEKYQYMYTCT